MRRFHCPASGRLLCQLSGAVTRRNEPFWGWTYSFVLDCPDCGREHDSLDRAEHEGVHPWHAGGVAKGLSAETFLPRYPQVRLERVPLEAVDDAAVDAAWSAIADLWDSKYDDRGDLNRRFQSDPVLFRMLGDVAGRRVLDAGSGQGYLCRLLARRGAEMTGVENAARFIELALDYQRRDPLPIHYLKGSISAMPGLANASFDLAVANYVLMDVPDFEGAFQELARVLRPGGVLVASLSHQSLDFGWLLAAPDSPRREDRLAWTDDDYFVRRSSWISWPGMEPFLSFHRPLKDYIAAARSAGLALTDLDEPELSDEGRELLGPDEVRRSRRAPVSYVLRFEKPPA